MKDLIRIAVQCILVSWYRVEVIIEELVDHDDRAIRDLRRPVIEMCEQRLNDVLCADDPFEIVVRFQKKTTQPFFPANSLGKIEPVKNGKFFLLVKDGNIVESDFV